MSEIVYHPPDQHRCHIGWVERDGRYFAELWSPVGTVRQCECGRTWVATPFAPVTSGLQRVGVEWLPEGWLARWRRERRAARAGDGQ